MSLSVWSCVGWQVAEQGGQVIPDGVLGAL